MIKRLTFVAFTLIAFTTNAQIESFNGEFEAVHPYDLALRTSSGTQLTISRLSGNIGIGKFPLSTFKLDVNGAINATSLSVTQLIVNGTEIVSGAASPWLTSPGNSSNIYYSTGSVGIGTNAPTDMFEVTGMARASQFNSVSGIFNVPNSANLSFNTNNTSRLTILSASGNVGIGVNNPGAKLDVAGDLVLNNGTLATSIYTGTGTTELSHYLQVSNSVGQPTPSGLKTGGVLVADNFGYASPGKNDLIVKGFVGIGTTAVANENGYALAVNGKIGTHDIQVERVSNAWPDYVFSVAYTLPSLNEVEKYIKENNHLEGVPTAEEVEKDGFSVSEMNTILLKKVEELTLYVIQQQKEIEALKTQVNKSAKD